MRPVVPLAVVSILAALSCAGQSPAEEAARAEGDPAAQTRPAQRPQSRPAATRPAAEDRGAADQDPDAPPLIHKGEPVRQLLPKDAIPSIDEPVFVKASEADFMSDQEPVLGIDASDPPRAYSTFQLEQHEIVNDEIGGRAIAATW